MTGWDSQEKRVFSARVVSPTLVGSDGGGGRMVCGYIFADRAGSGTDSPAWCLQGNCVDRPDTASCNGRGWKADVRYTLNTIDRHAVAYSFDSPASNSMKSRDPHSGCRIVDVSKTFDASGPAPSRNQGGIAILQRVFGARGNSDGKTVCTLTGDHQDRVTDYTAAAAINGTVRRLTPLEYERLQGYPDGWTDIGAWTDSKGKLHKGPSDSARYKALGNSIALPPWAWVLERLCGCYGRHTTMASPFDGIGGFPLIWERLNGPGSCLWASEIEELPIAVTKHHFGREHTVP